MALLLLPNMLLAQDFRVSLSVSPFTEIVLNLGNSFTEGAVTATTVEGVQRLFVNHGSNEVYARIATTQKYRIGFGDHSLDRGLERARMAAALHRTLTRNWACSIFMATFAASPRPNSRTIRRLSCPEFGPR